MKIEQGVAIGDGPTLTSFNPVFRRGILAAALVTLAGCSDACLNSPVSHAGAPGGAHSAVMFQRDCGATTGFSTQVSIVARGEEASGSGNVFRADDDHGAAVAGKWGGPWAEIGWLAQDRLLIRYAAKSRIFDQKSEVSGIRISYQQVGAESPQQHR